MKLRHPITGAIYTKREDGLVLVEDGERSGLFRTDGRYVKGEIREADPHLLNWLEGAVALPSRRVGAAAPAPELAARPVGVPVPTLAATNTRTGGRRTGMDLGLEGRKALVTASTRGIGLAIAQTLADEGCDVAICARGEGGLESARKDLEGRGATVFSRAVDVADGEAFKQFVSDAAEALGGLDIYVSNASGGAGPGEKAWQASFDVDVMGAVRGVEAALPSLAQSEAGSVIFISSTAALEYLGIPQAYNAMKAALIAHAGDLSQALAGQGVRVNVITPGPIYFEGGNWEMIKQAMPKMYEGAVAQCAIGRMGTPEEVARATVFLASPAASLITGANLVCDGGFTKRNPF
jgi:NAD(P)-dependent dehydrogenase (short-subunit alcohol dehydrogenase family)